MKSWSDWKASTWGKPIARAQWLRSRLERSAFILLLLLIIGMRAQWEDVFAKVFVTSIFSQFESSLPLDLAFLLVFAISLILGIAFLWERKQKVSFGNWDWTIILLLSFHLSYRLGFLAAPWQYTGSLLIPQLAYLDILLLGLGILWLAKWMKKWLKKPSAPAAPEAGVNLIDPDAPILTEEDSISTQRNHLARDIATRIHHFRPKSQAFAIGIEGAWGSGKTSIWNLIKNELNTRHEDPDRVIIEFTPWYFNDVESLLGSFFKTLERESRSYDPDYARMLAKYGSRIATAEKTFLRSGYGSYFLNWLDQSNSLMDQRDRISDRIKDWNRKYVIFIDDLDRLGKNEVIAVLRLVRLCANFAHTIFVVAFDRGYVEEAVKDLNAHNYTGYMEKVFQQIFALPAYHEEHLVEALESSLGKLIPEEYGHIEKKLFADIQQNRPVFVALLTNIRDVKRLANSFFFAMNTLWDEVSPGIMLMLELVRQKHRPVYNWYYRMSLIWTGLSKPATPSGRVEKGWEQMLQDLSDEVGFPQELIYHFKNLAEYFNDHPQGLTIPQYHRKYFSFYLDEKTDLSGTLFRKQFDLQAVTSDEEWKDNLTNWLNSHLDWSDPMKEAENQSILEARKGQLLNELQTMPKGGPESEADLLRALAISLWIEGKADKEKKYFQTIDYLLRYLRPKPSLLSQEQLDARKQLMKNILGEIEPVSIASRSLRLMLKPVQRLSPIQDGQPLFSTSETEELLELIWERATIHSHWEVYLGVREDLKALIKDDTISPKWEGEKLGASLAEKIKQSPKDFYSFILEYHPSKGYELHQDRVRELFSHSEGMWNELQKLKLEDRASVEFGHFEELYKKNRQEPLHFGFVEIDSR